MERALTRRDLNRALLARQLLLERGPEDLPGALERVGGIQAQYAPSMYVGLWSRVRGLERERLTRALEAREVVQGTLMRVTIHLVSRADYRPLALATRAARRQWWLRAHRAVAPEAMEEAARAVRARLAEAGTLHRRDLEGLVGKERAGGVGHWLDLVRVPPSGTWERRRADLFAAAEEWLGAPVQHPGAQGRDLAPPELNLPAATEHLVRRYLGAFGPAPAGDVANWAGLTRTALAPVLARMDLSRLRGEGGAELLDLPGAPLPEPDTPAPPRFLPTWDATLLAHARRAGVLEEEHRPLIFTPRNPQSLPTFLVDGVVAGTWRHEAGTIRLDPFGRLGASDRRALRQEADRLAALHA